MYKRQTSTTSLLNLNTLSEFIDFYNHFDSRRRQQLVEKTAWPLRLVRDHGSVTGFIMPALRPEFYITITLRNSVQRSTEATIEQLCLKPLILHNRGTVISRRDEYLLLKDLSEVLSFLHSEGVVVGDFSVKNIFYALRPNPKVFIIDCDSMILHGKCCLLYTSDAADDCCRV